MLHESSSGPRAFPPDSTGLAGGPFLVVSFADVAPHTQRACQEFLPQLAQAGVSRVSLLLVPCCQGAESILGRPYFGRWMRSLVEAGHEICLHGPPHLAEAGTALCAQLGVAAAGFMPPAGPLAPEARAALVAGGFAYAATASGLDLLRSGRHLPAPVVRLDAGSSWRVPDAWLRARLVYAARRGAPVLRLAVQPCALYQPALRQTLLTLVREALATRTAATCGELAARASAFQSA